MARRNIVVIGASAGGIEALQLFLGALPANLEAAVLIVLHTSNHAGSLLPQILQRACHLPTIEPKDGARIERGKVYIAPADFHMIVEGDFLRIIQGPRENHHRPAIDPLFRSAAASHGKRVVGIILTGALDDGTAGLMVVRARGGEAVVQDPDDALFSSMPQSAMEQIPDAHVLPLRDIPNMVVHLTREEIPDEAAIETFADERPIQETRIAELDMSEIENEDRPGHPSAFACPDCGGVLWEIEDSGFLRFRCRVGHAFTARHLGAEQRYAIETALWSALRALEERASLYHRMADRASDSNHEQTAETYKERALNTTANARVLREFLVRVNEGEEERFAAEGMK
jgi:two-component system, chemotaxis family, protein-glutamate methylesterase/glutaminase